MSRLAKFAVCTVLLTSTVGCFQSRWAGYGGGGCCPPSGGVYGAPGGGQFMAPQSNFYSPTGMGTPISGPTAYGAPIYGSPAPVTAYGTPMYGGQAPMTAFAPLDPLPTY